MYDDGVPTNIKYNSCRYRVLPTTAILNQKGRNTVERKPIQVSLDTWAIICKESRLQGAAKNIPVSMGDVVSQFARKLDKKHKKG